MSLVLFDFQTQKWSQLAEVRAAFQTPTVDVIQTCRGGCHVDVVSGVQQPTCPCRSVHRPLSRYRLLLLLRACCGGSRRLPVQRVQVVSQRGGAVGKRPPRVGHIGTVAASPELGPAFSRASMQNLRSFSTDKRFAMGLPLPSQVDRFADGGNECFSRPAEPPVGIDEEFGVKCLLLGSGCDRPWVMMDGHHQAGAQMPGHQGSFMGVHVACNSVDAEQSNVRVARLEPGVRGQSQSRVAAMVDRQSVDAEQNPHCRGSPPIRG